MRPFLTVDAHSVAHLRGAVDVMLVTATATEFAAVRRRLAPLPEGRLCKTFVYNETYYLGQYGGCTAVLVQCGMGAAGRDAALAVCTSALQVWRPRAVIMVGIAFGKDPESQRMCDVLVASSLIPYELAKLGPQYVARSPHPPTNTLLLNRFTNATDWSFRRGRSKAGIWVGPLLTGEKVLDNPTAKAKLFRLFPHAIGGEMEGAGVFAAADRASTPWILVKAICDWGDGTKSNEFQVKAATAAASLVYHVLSEQACLDALPTPAVLNDSDPFRAAVSAIHINPSTGPGPRVAHSVPVGLPPVAPAAERVSTGARDGLATSARPELLPVPKALPGVERRSVRVRPALLGRLELHALRLIVRAPADLPGTVLKFLFPRVDWKRALTALRRKGVIDTSDPLRSRIARSVTRQACDVGAAKRYDGLWLRRLEALREHSDTAILLGLLYLRAKRYNEAVAVLSNIAEGLESGPDNLCYKRLLKPMMAPRFLRRLTTERRIQLLNAFALCCSRAGEYDDSLLYFDRLRQLSRKSGSAWGMGQSYINAGVSHFRLGNTEKAQRCYRLAVAHGQRTRDRWLQARALHNLGTMLLETSPEEGIALIEKSLKLKIKNGDIAGVAAAFLSQGNSHTLVGRRRDALNAYREAAALARKLDMRQLLGLALSNIGSAHVDLGEVAKALPFYRKARELGEREGLQDVERFALQGQAVAYSRLERYGPSMQSFLRLADLRKTDPNRTARLAALHDAGIMAARAGEPLRAKKELVHALRLARAVNDQMWLFRCHLAMATVTGNDNDAAVQSRLKVAAASTSARGQHFASSRLWIVILERLISSNGDVRLIERAAQRALSECALAGRQSASVEVYKRLCVWRRDRGEPAEALKCARLIAKHAVGAGNSFDRIAAIDEQGCCYQRLGKTSIAERIHRRALGLAERTNEAGVIAIPLTNLASLLRITGRLEEARALLSRAEALAVERDDIPLMALVASDLALVLADSGEHEEARRLLEAWQRRTAVLGMWPERILALHRLANMAYQRGRLERAQELYQRALSEAERREDAAQRDIAENFVSLLVEQMRRALLAGERARGERIFARAKALTGKYSLALSYRELLLALGDVHWRRGPRHFAAGTQAYLAAFAELPDVDAEEMVRLNGRAGVGLVLHFYHVPVSYPLARLEKVAQKAVEWLRTQCKGELTDAVETLLCWPLTTGLRVARLMRSGHPPAGDAVGQLVAEEFVAAWTRLRPRARIQATVQGYPSRLTAR